jgi:hypothetical protein
MAINWAVDFQGSCTHADTMPCLHRDSHPRPSSWEANILTIRPRRSLSMFTNFAYFAHHKNLKSTRWEGKTAYRYQIITNPATLKAFYNTTQAITAIIYPQNYEIYVNYNFNSHLKKWMNWNSSEYNKNFYVSILTWEFTELHFSVL